MTTYPGRYSSAMTAELSGASTTLSGISSASAAGVVLIFTWSFVGATTPGSTVPTSSTPGLGPFSLVLRDAGNHATGSDYVTLEVYKAAYDCTGLTPAHLNSASVGVTAPPSSSSWRAAYFVADDAHPTSILSSSVNDFTGTGTLSTPLTGVVAHSLLLFMGVRRLDSIGDPSAFLPSGMTGDGSINLGVTSAYTSGGAAIYGTTAAGGNLTVGWTHSEVVLDSVCAAVALAPYIPTASLSALPTAIYNSTCIGDTSTLTWSTSDSTSRSIDQGVGSVAVSGSEDVSPIATTTYTLTASNPSNSATATATVIVTPNTVAPDVTTGAISYFNDGATFDAGRYVVGYDSGAYKINPGITQQPGVPWGVGFRDNDAQIDGSHGYYVTDGASNEARGPGNLAGYASQAAAEAGNAGEIAFYDHVGGPIGIYLLDGKYSDNVAGNPSPTFTLCGPIDATLTASASSIDVGDSVTLTWGTTNATSATDPVGGSTTSGSQSVSPTADTTYSMTANGAASNTKTVTLTVTVNQPTAPTALTATGQCGGTIDLAWSGATHTASYSLERSATGADSWSEIYAGSTAAYTDTPPVAGAAYWYRVKSVKSSATSGASTTATDASILPAPTPTGLTVTAGDTTNALAWSSPVGSYGTITVNIYRSTATGAETLLASGQTGASYTDTGLTNGQPYYYTLAFVNDCGTGSQCAEVSATPQYGVNPFSAASSPSTTYTVDTPPTSTYTTGAAPSTTYTPTPPPG